MTSERDKMWQTAARYSAVGIEMAASVAIGVYAGMWLDTKLGTEPYLFYVGLGVGVGAAVSSIVRAVRQYQRDSRDDDPGHQQ